MIQYNPYIRSSKFKVNSLKFTNSVRTFGLIIFDQNAVLSSVLVDF